jgi:periplasmic protein TonB
MNLNKRMMKKIKLIFAAMSLFSIGAMAQVSDDQSIFNLQEVERIPVFPGCEGLEGDELMNCFNMGIITHISQNFVYPEDARQQGIEGRMYINFIVEKNGTVSNVIVARSAHALLDEAGLAAMSNIPQLEPAIANGQPVRMQYTVPINARLSAEKDKK